jgi:hypothetical protein
MGICETACGTDVEQMEAEIIGIGIFGLELTHFHCRLIARSNEIFRTVYAENAGCARIRDSNPLQEQTKQRHHSNQAGFFHCNPPWNSTGTLCSKKDQTVLTLSWLSYCSGIGFFVNWFHPFSQAFRTTRRGHMDMQRQSASGRSTNWPLPRL